MTSCWLYLLSALLCSLKEAASVQNPLGPMERGHGTLPNQVKFPLTRGVAGNSFASRGLLGKQVKRFWQEQSADLRQLTSAVRAGLELSFSRAPWEKARSPGGPEELLFDRAFVFPWTL